MPIDYTVADRVLGLVFGKLNTPAAPMAFPRPGTLASQLSTLMDSSFGANPVIPHNQSRLFASAGIEMWHRAIHSLLWSIALTESSPLWSSVSGYYSSHFVMRALAHSMGFFKSFHQRKLVQVITDKGAFVCTFLQNTEGGEHSFYWKVVKNHPAFLANPLFRTNSERDPRSDSAHRNFANYTDNLDSFRDLVFPDRAFISANIEKIERIRLYSITEASRDDYPDLQNVQILAFQRIVAFHDFLDKRIPDNRFWQAHRRPTWCRDLIRFQVDDEGLERLASL